MLTAKIYCVSLGIAATVGIAASVGFGQADQKTTAKEPVKPIVEAPVVKAATPSLDDDFLKQTPAETTEYLKGLPQMLPIAENDNELTVLRKMATIAAAKQVEILFSKVLLGKDSLITFLQGVENLANSNLELCKDDDQRLAVLAQQYILCKESWRLTRVLVDAGVRQPQDLYQVEFSCWRARLQFRKLEQAKNAKR